MKYTRRQFIGTAAGIGAVLAHPSLAGEIPALPAKHDPYEPVEIGRTSIRTTRLCMGTGIKSSQRQSHLTRMGYDRGVALVREVYGRGVRMFDTADLYGTHGIVSEALRPFPRKDYVLFSKIWFRSGGLPENERPDAETVVSRFLRELQTDYIDGVMLHCVTSGNWNTELSSYMEELDKMKQKGVIRAHGITCHSLQALQTAAKESWVDCLNVRINAYGNHMDDKVETVEPVVKQLRAAGKGIIAMKVMGEGELVNSDEQKDRTLHYVLGAGVNILDIGIGKIEDIIDIEPRIRKIDISN
jgi:aryl-alcohol dehydrogenase-like predicted oxidoreductase